jgi:energy-coupling factor transporter transmembrane protein EcfT
LVLSALNKVDYLSISMESRAFGLYKERSYLSEQVVKKEEWLFLLLSLILLSSGTLLLK